MIRIYSFILLFFANINFASADIFNDIKNILADKSIPSCQNNRYSHRCSIKYDTGDKYVGGWDGSYLTGKGHYKWKSGEIYSGEWRLTKRHGEGINYYPNGEIARGKFVDDKLTGFATYIWVNGDKAIGNFKDFKLVFKSIKGIFTFKLFVYLFLFDPTQIHLQQKLGLN